MEKLIIVFISDTHGKHRDIEIPEGDILIHCGDFTNTGRVNELWEFNKFLGELSHPYKIIVAGNHEIGLEHLPIYETQKILANATYLQDSEIIIEGLKFYGSPWQPEFMNWAFNLKRGKEIREKWDLIPNDTDVLITHGPPYGLQDSIRSDSENIGCEDLLEKVTEIQPRIHAFGHIHGGYGITDWEYLENTKKRTLFINASICNESYKAINIPLIAELKV